MKALSKKRKQVLDAITGFLDRHKYPPSVRDVVQMCSMSSTSVADYHLKALERDGYIRRESGVSRGIEVIGYDSPGPDVFKAPLLGSIAAGEPLPVPTAEPWASLESIEVPDDMVSGKENVYALKVKGTSMIDAFIDDGDIVLLQHVDTADDGDMVAAWLEAEEEVTLKRLYRESDRIRLEPANAQMDPIYVDPSNLSVKGRVIGVIRKMA
jgi:repressor LexA